MKWLKLKQIILKINNTAISSIVILFLLWALQSYPFSFVDNFHTSFIKKIIIFFFFLIIMLKGLWKTEKNINKYQSQPLFNKYWLPK